MYWSDWLLTMPGVAMVRHLALQASQLLSDICRKILRVGSPYYDDYYYCTQAGFSGVHTLAKLGMAAYFTETERSLVRN